MTLNITSKLTDVGTSIFAVMSAMAQQYQAHNLAQGFPEFEPDDWLKQRVSHYINTGHNQYAPMTGTPQLRQAISHKVADYYGYTPDPDTEITITSGATEALFAAIQCVVKPGDEVIVFDPAYDAYDPAVRLAGGKVLHLPLLKDSFGIDYTALQAAFSSKTRLIVINSPHNPSGAILSQTDLDKLSALISNSDCLLLSDEVYEHIIFDGKRHASVLADATLRKRSFAVSSFGKTYHMTGWKVGYCIAPPELSVEFRKLHQFLTFATSTPMQLAIADMMNHAPDYGRELADFYQQKRDCFVAALEGSRFKIIPCYGTYFQLLDYSEISDKDDMAFTEWLTKEVGVATIPISPFCSGGTQQRLIRCCFAKSEATLHEVANILKRL